MDRNCKEFATWNDDNAAANETDLQLVHITYWNGLGEPSKLAYDHIL